MLATGQRGSYGRAHDGTIAGSTVCNEGERTKWPRPISETDCVEHSMGSIFLTDESIQPTISCSIACTIMNVWRVQPTTTHVDFQGVLYMILSAETCDILICLLMACITITL